jgi:hypothetical protein
MLPKRNIGARRKSRPSRLAAVGRLAERPGENRIRKETEVDDVQPAYGQHGDRDEAIKLVVRDLPVAKVVEDGIDA